MSGKKFRQALATAKGLLMETPDKTLEQTELTVEGVINADPELEKLAHEFAREHGRRTLIHDPSRKFTRPDPDLYWGLKNGFIAGHFVGAAEGEKRGEARVLQIMNDCNEPE